MSVLFPLRRKEEKKQLEWFMLQCCWETVAVVSDLRLWCPTWWLVSSQGHLLQTTEQKRKTMLHAGPPDDNEPLPDGDGWGLCIPGIQRCGQAGYDLLFPQFHRKEEREDRGWRGVEDVVPSQQLLPRLTGFRLGFRNQWGGDEKRGGREGATCSIQIRSEPRRTTT